MIKLPNKMRIIKRNNMEMDFDINKIIHAIERANEETAAETSAEKISDTKIKEIAEFVEFKCSKLNRAVSVEEIQDLVENQLMNTGACDLARHYVRYRYVHNIMRTRSTTDDKILALVNCVNEEAKQENSNKNPVINSVQRDYIAGEVSRDITTRLLLPPEISEAHKNGILHFHDSDYYLQFMHNCCLINLDDMLQNGTVISETLIEKPHSFSTACTITTQIVAQVASNQYGGQSISLTHLAPFVDISRKKIHKEILDELAAVNRQMTDEEISKIVEMRLKEEIKKGIQTIQYQIVTLLTTNGQAPFVTLFMYLNEARTQREKDDLAMIIEEVIRQRITGVKNEKGVWISPAFPKLIYVLEEDNITEESKYWYLTKLAAKCSAKRLVPDYISEKVMKKLKGDVYTCMGCRSFLTPDTFTEKGIGNIANAKNYEPGKHKYYGRFNQGVVTVNLVDIGLSAHKDINEFWKIFDERMELCHKALRLRHERLLGTHTDAAPILWQHGALSRLEKGEVIDKLLYNGYSTISLGYAGLWECVYSLIEKKLTEPEGKELGLQIMQKLNDYCTKWRKAENIDYSIYGTPLESTTYKFAKCLQKRFGIIKGITDKNYITNSYHIHVTEPVTAFEKIKIESEFQALSPGGAISYVETPNLQNNIEAVLAVMKYIYDNIIYAELNTKSDYCQVCGYDGEIQITENENKKLIWKCPNCGNTDQDKMNVARRTCGYIGTQFWNQGRTQEIKDRVLHI